MIEQNCSAQVERPEASEPEESSKWYLYERFKKDLRERCLDPDHYETELRRVLDDMEL